MKLILHIGDIKTGTSAIQQHFHAHKDAYLKFGLQYIHDEKRTDFRSLSSAINTEVTCPPRSAPACERDFH